MIKIKYKCVAAMLMLGAISCSGQEKRGANIPWQTYEAEEMDTDGNILGPKYKPYLVETESSGQKCVKLNKRGQYVKFTAAATANTMIIRYSLPDKKEGNGLTASLNLYKNGNFLGSYQLTSRYSHVYGKYPFVNTPNGGLPRNFYDDVRIKGLQITKGDVLEMRWENRPGDEADYCIIDLADLENVAPALIQPSNALAITNKSFAAGNLNGDYTLALKMCIDSAVKTQKIVWIPEGTYKISGDIVVPANITLQGAGMWYTTLTGDETKYAKASKRVRIMGTGSNIHLADFAIIGKLNYRSDKEENDGIGGSYGENSTINRLWIEHTKVGMWIENSYGLQITGCRMRNTMADGINFCVGMAYSVIDNCTARNTGDDCFAIWPAVFSPQQFTPGHNLITNCTAQLPFLANGAAIYGGESNMIRDCTFTDISQGSAILISNTFPTQNATINNNFNGKTVVQNCDIKTSGGFDHEWDWRAAVEIALDKRSIAGLEINNLTITESFSNGISVIGRTVLYGCDVSLTNAKFSDIKIKHYGLGVGNSHGLFVNDKACGGLTIQNSPGINIGNKAENFIIIK